MDIETEECKMKKKYMLLTSAAALLVAAGLTGCQSGGVPDTIRVENVEGNTIEVSSTEEVRVVPDMAQITYSAYTQEADAVACQEKNQQELDKVVDLLTSYGIDEKSIQTSNYGLSPIYDWNSGKTVTGYEMDTRVIVSDVAIDQVGTLLTESIGAGINSVESVDYLCSDFDDSYEEALKLAVESARVKAQAMAEAGNCSLGDIVNIVEYGNNQSARYTGYRNMAKLESGAGAAMDTAAMAVMPGEVSVEANITVEFAIE